MILTCFFSFLLTDRHKCFLLYQIKMVLQRSLRDLGDAVEKNDTVTICKVLSKIPELVDDPNSHDVLLNLPDFNQFGSNVNLIKYLNRAILKSNLQLVEFFLKKGVKLDDAAACRYVFCGNDMKTSKNLLLLLMKYGLKVIGVKNQIDQNLLHSFIDNFVKKEDEDAVEIAEILLNTIGIPVDETDEFGATALSLSVNKENTRLVSYLIEKGAKVNHAGGRTPLNAAVFTGNEDLVSLLLSSGANINGKSRTGQTALHSACYIHKESMIKLLVHNGADISAQDENGKTPYSRLEPEYNYYKNCRLAMIKEFSKLTFENIPVSQFDINLVRENPDAREEFEKCLEELKLMAETKFYAPYSYYRVLKRSMEIKKLSKLAKNEELFSKFEEFMCKVSYYKKDLQEVFENAVTVRDRSDEVVSRLSSVFEKILPEDVILNFSEYLGVEDIPRE